MRDAGRRAVQGTETAFTLAVTGTPHRCDQDVEHQALRIGREALSNAVRHAHARNISVELSYETEQLVVRVSDDGCGFDMNGSPRDLDPHCGLLIMQERAAQVGGHVTFGTNAASGTVVEALLPTSVKPAPQGAAC
jgi:signal transduction histidine kinase